MRNEILRMDKVTQMDGGVPVLENINLHLFQGEILGLVCLNDYGQEELVDLLRQNKPLHYGKIYLNDRLVNSYEHSSMSYNRVAVIDHQSRLVDDLTVADNIFVLRREFRKRIISSRQLNQQLKLFTDDLDIRIQGNQLVRDLSIYEKCVVELLKAVVIGTKLIVIRNISNYVSTSDLLKLQRLLRYYSGKGFSFLYICSHHEEAFKICDRMALLQNTVICRVLDSSQFTRKSMEPYYLDLYKDQQFSSPSQGSKGLLRMERLYAGRLRDLSLGVEAGECVVMLDTDHSSIPDILAVMRGEETVRSGHIYLDGKPYLAGWQRGTMENGVAFIQQYPTTTMLFPEMSYIDNLCFLVDKKRQRIHINRRIRQSVIREYGAIIGPDIEKQDITGLGIGSLYNLVYYRVHLGNPGAVFCVQPFSDADIALRLQIIRLIHALKRKGIAVIILAVNLSDSLLIADRLMILKQGQIHQEISRSEFHQFSKEATIL